MRNAMRWQFSLPAAVWLAFWLYYDHNGDAVYTICAAAFHECGHLLLLFLLHDMPQKLQFGVFGARIERAPSTRLSYRQEIAVHAAGPAANLLLAVCLLPLCASSPRLRRAVRVNLLLAAFNLLPIRPMDGGEILFAALCLRTSPAKAAAWCKKIAACGIVPPAAIGLFCFLRGKGSYTLLFSVVYVLSLLLPSSSI